MRGDAPLATITAIIGAVVIVILLVGVRASAAITLACCLAGAVGMLACASLLGLRVNFLDFVSLPITIGIGIDYSVNIVARARQDGPGSARAALSTTGGAVAL